MTRFPFHIYILLLPAYADCGLRRLGGPPLGEELLEELAERIDCGDRDGLLGPALKLRILYTSRK